MRRYLACPSCKSRHLAVAQRLCNHSKFNGGHYTASDWSEIRCLNCYHPWRTKSPRVEYLPDLTQAMDDAAYDALCKRGEIAKPPPQEETEK